ncbi:MAG: sigma-54 dependent transcriptional regulator [Terracidiphilus sp.]
MAQMGVPRETANHRQKVLPPVCLVSADEDFIKLVALEIEPWCSVTRRGEYDGLARWTQRQDTVSAIVLDIDTTGKDTFGGLRVLNELRRLDANLTLISISRAAARSVEKQALEAGADAHFRSPVDLIELRTALVELLRDSAEMAKRNHVLGASRFQDFVGSSEPMRLVYDAIQQVAGSSINVLIRGESGTGKELAARAIVALSRRSDKPFIRLNCAALPENLIESELFGSERGAFTGATESRPGQIELADGGTLFLDEIATLAVPLQTKLLRVLEDHQVQRLGGRAFRKIDFRLICATNEPLEEMARTGRFREDLYYRIHVIPIDLPPLRDRRGDLALLCEYFLQVHCPANGIPVKRLTEEALAALEEHTWPGNVRELENLIQRLVVTVRGDEIGVSHLPSRLVAESIAVQEAVLLPAEGADFDKEVSRLEIALLTTALNRSGGSKAAAARLLYLDGQRMKYLCRKYGL